MVTCPNCQIQNSLDSQFCKGCGKNLPQDAVAEAQREHETLVAEGYKALNEARVEEALLIAISALEQFPESVSALSLKGMAHERQGSIAEALDTFEKVLALNPNSALDKIKVQQLRNSMSAKLLHADTATPNKKIAVFAAVAAIVLVGAIGVLAANFANPNSTTAQTPDNYVAMNDKKSNVTNPGQTQGANQTNPQTKTDQPKLGPGDEQPLREGAKPNSPGGIVKVPSGNQLPGANGGGEPWNPVGPGPITIDPEGIRNPPLNNNNPPTANKPDPDEVDPDVPKTDPNKTTPTQPTENSGVIEIKTSRGTGNENRNGGTSVGGGDMGSQALLAAAKQQFQLGKYDQAARSYERLLSMGGDAATINQRLGQCYQHLGQNGAAAQAYQRAISALEARIKAGGDTSSAQSMLRTCRAALKVVS